MTALAAIELKSDSLRLVVGESTKLGSPLRIRHAVTVAIAPGSTPEDRALAIKEALKLAGMSVQQAHLVLPRSEANCRKALLPSSDPDELAGMARFEADRHLPLNAERHIVEHAVLGKPAVEGTEVLIAAVDEPVALESLDSAALAGIDVASIGISTLALFRAWVSARGGQVVSPTLLLHLDEDSTELVVVANGQPAYNRSAPVGLRKLFADVAAAGPIPFGPGELGCLDALEPHQLFLGDHGQDPAAAANEPQGAVARGWLLRLLREIRLTVDFARRDANAPSPDCIFLSGTGAQILHMPEFLAANTGATAELWDPWAAHEAPVDVPGLDRPGARLSYATLAGALLPQQPQVPYPNLIPSRYLATRKEKARQRFLVVVSVQVVAVLILGYIFLAQHMNHMRQTIEAYQEKNRSLSSVAADLEAKQARNQIVRRFLGARSTPMEVLNQISNFDFIPDKVTLTRVEYKKDEYVKLTGHALDIAGVNAMESALRQTGLFSKVSQDQGSNAPVQLPNRGKDGTVLQFSITCEIEKPSGRSMRKTGNATVVTQP